jgi:hypothetical protein
LLLHDLSIGARQQLRCRRFADVILHALRREATSRPFEEGYSIQEATQLTLHKSWGTLKRYTHLRPEDVPDRQMPSSPTSRMSHQASGFA